MDLDYTPLLTAMNGDSIGLALLELSAALTGRDDAVAAGMAIVDELARTVHEPTPSGLIDSLFGHHGLCGDVGDYHAVDNSFLDRVLERRLGMPITLSAAVIEVGRALDLPLTMVAMPGHVVVGTSETDRYIDAFGGVAIDTDGLKRRFAAIFGEEASFASHDLVTLDPTGAVNRVCNNLVRSWSADRSGKIDRLLTLRAAIPGSETDRTLVIGIAEARGRFDIAAALRAELDPDDPEVQQLWGRLN